MAPTPYTAPHQLDIEYVFSGFTHKLQIPVSAVDSGGTYYLERFTLADRLLTDCVADFVLLFKPLFAATCNIARAVLQANLGGIFIPLATVPIGVVGTGAGSNIVASQATVTLRDTDYKIARLMWFESRYSAPNKAPYPTGDANLDPFLEDIIVGGVSANPMHEWWRSRGNRQIQSASYFTATFNRKLRRHRGVG